MLNSNYYDAEDCHCGIPVLEFGTKLCSECKRLGCSKGDLGCIIFGEYRTGVQKRAANRKTPTR